MSRAVFLDRDGTLIADANYLRSPEQIVILPGAGEALSRLHRLGLLLIVVTNQSGVARGLFTEADVAAVHASLRSRFAAMQAPLTDMLYCPDHPEGVVPRYRRESDWRKPAPGMLREAARRHGIDLSRSFMIGDADRDRDAGRAAGCRSIRLASSPDPLADHTAADLSAAADWIAARLEEENA